MKPAAVICDGIICEAITKRCRLEFEYDGLVRVVEPYCHGVTTRGLESLRAVQVGGAAGRLGFGKLWTVDKIKNIRLGAPFRPRDPNYNPDDSAMSRIHCRI
jgi:hypothetical protein